MQFIENLEKVSIFMFEFFENIDLWLFFFCNLKIWSIFINACGESLCPYSWFPMVLLYLHINGFVKWKFAFACVLIPFWKDNDMKYILL